MTSQKIKESGSPIKKTTAHAATGKSRISPFKKIVSAAEQTAVIPFYLIRPILAWTKRRMLAQPKLRAYVVDVSLRHPKLQHRLHKVSEVINRPSQMSLRLPKPLMYFAANVVRSVARFFASLLRKLAPHLFDSLACNKKIMGVYHRITVRKGNMSPVMKSRLNASAEMPLLTEVNKDGARASLVHAMQAWSPRRRI